MQTGYRAITARFDSECHWCGLPIKKGRTLHWNPVKKRAVCSIGCILGITAPKTYPLAREDLRASIRSQVAKE